MVVLHDESWMPWHPALNNTKTHRFRKYLNFDNIIPEISLEIIVISGEIVGIRTNGLENTARKNRKTKKNLYRVHLRRDDRLTSS